MTKISGSCSSSVGQSFNTLCSTRGHSPPSEGNLFSIFNPAASTASTSSLTQGSSTVDSASLKITRKNQILPAQDLSALTPNGPPLVCVISYAQQTFCTLTTSPPFQTMVSFGLAPQLTTKHTTMGTSRLLPLMKDFMQIPLARWVYSCYRLNAFIKYMDSNNKWMHLIFANSFVKVS